jgi:CHAT domain-containing protein
LPFESLVVEPGDDHAATRYWLDVGPDVVYGASGSVLAWCRDRRRQQASAEPARDVLVVADPSLEAAGMSLEPLPGARREGAAIRATFEREPDAVDEVRVLSGAEASETRLFELAPGARFLHVATHQITGRAGDTTGRLVLAQVREPSLHDDGFVDLDDLLQRWRGRMPRCELVVLSACGSALGTQVAGEEILGLPWGLYCAGAPAVLASLWPVSDTATAELMSELYARLAAKDGTTRVRSFTEARRALRRDWPAPYYWAPFVWTGSPR